MQQRNFAFPLYLILGCVFLADLIVAPAQTLLIDEPRPLAKAALLWELHSGIPVSYEDAPYAYSGDLIDETAPAFKKDHPTITAYNLRGGSLRLEINLPSRSADPAEFGPFVTAGIQKAISDHALGAYPGRFKLSQTLDALAIVPITVADKDGKFVSVVSPLDVAITFPTRLRDGLSAIEAICQRINATAGKNLVGMGTMPPSLQFQQIAVGADKEIARNVLVRVLSGLQWSDSRNLGKPYRMSWRLLYGPDTNIQRYALNVHIVEVEKASANGVVGKIPVPRQ